MSDHRYCGPEQQVIPGMGYAVQFDCEVRGTKHLVHPTDCGWSRCIECGAQTYVVSSPKAERECGTYQVRGDRLFLRDENLSASGMTLNQYIWDYPLPKGDMWFCERIEADRGYWFWRAGVAE